MAFFNPDSMDQSVLLQAVVESLIDGVLVVSRTGEIVQSNNRGRQICKRLRRQPDALPTSSNPPTPLSNITHLNQWKMVPADVWTVCQTLLDSSIDFPNLNIIPEHQLILNKTSAEDKMLLRIRAQWLHFPPAIARSRGVDSNGQDHKEGCTECRSEAYSKCRSEAYSESCSESRTGRCCTEASSESGLGNASLGYILVTLEDRNQSIQNLATTDQQRYQLTPREAEIWQLRLRGQSYRDIAQQLVISQNTVKKHLKNILSKRRMVLGEVVG